MDPSELLPVDLPEGTPPWDPDLAFEDQYQAQRQELRRWNQRKLEALAIRRCLPMWPLYVFTVIACFMPMLERPDQHYTRMLVAFSFGWSFAQMFCVLRSAYLEHQADKKMQAGIRRIIDWQPGTAS